MEGSNKGGKYAIFSTFTFNQHISIFMIRIFWVSFPAQATLIALHITFQQFLYLL